MKDLFNYLPDDRKSLSTDIWHPDKISSKEFIWNVNPLTDELIKKNLGQRWKTNLINLVRFLTNYRHQVSLKTDFVYEFKIPQSSEKLVKAFGSQQNVKKLLDKLQILGILQKTHNGFYSCNPEERKCARYAFNVRNADYLVDYSQRQGITFANKPIRQDLETRNAWNTFDLGDEDYLNGRTIKIGSENLDYCDDLTVFKGLVRSYPWIDKIMDSVDRINGKLSDREKIKFCPNIKRKPDGSIDRISIRAYSRVCSYPKEVRSEIYPDCDENDIKSSIHRITCLINKGVWLDDGVDLYREFWRRDFNTRKERNQIKNLTNRLYFSKFSSVQRWMRQEATMRNCICTKDDLTEALMIREKMSDICGSSLGSEVFLFESSVYILTVERILEKNIPVSLVYDGFIIPKFYPREEFLSDVKLSAEKFLNTVNLLV